MLNMGKSLSAMGIAFVLSVSACGGGGGGGGGGVTVVTPPLVSVTVPVSGDIGIPLDSNVTITWDQPINCNTVNTATVTATVAGWTRLSCAGDHAIFQAVGQDYRVTNQVTVTSAVRNTPGTAMESPHVFSYTATEAPLGWLGTTLVGGSGFDGAIDGAIGPNGNIYIVGGTRSALPGDTNAGGMDVFVGSFQPDGQLRWLVEFGGAGDDEGLGIAVSGSTVYVVGTFSSSTSLGNLVSGDTVSNNQAFLAKLNDNTTSASIAWTRRFGTTQNDSARAVAIDAAGDIIVAGSTFGTLAGTGSAGDEDAFLAKFTDATDTDTFGGTRIWVSQFGLDGSDEDAAAVAVAQDGFIYTAGRTEIVDNNGDSYAARNRADDGSQLTQWRLGQTSGTDYANALAIDGQNKLYVAGRTETDIDGDGIANQGADAFLAKIDPSSTAAVQWVEVIASPGEDEAFGVAVDDFGNLYVTGEANGALNGETNAGGGDIFTARFSLDGDRNWLDLLGTAANESGFEVFLGERGTVFVAGATLGELDGAVNAGDADAFLVRYTSAGVLE